MARYASHENSRSFFALCNSLIAVSRMEASALPSQVSLYTNRKGPRPLVYLALFPAACSAIRRSRLLVMPVYRLPSAHSSI